MTIQSLYTAATGMQALETKLDVIANNMANVNTVAFKKDRANFEDLFYRQLQTGVAAAYQLAGQTMACNMMDEAALDGVQAFLDKRTRRSA